MSCYHPVEVEVARKSFYGGPRVKDLCVVPCGNCLGCRAKQAAEWTMRLMHESRMHDDSWFVTLTYEDRRLPENGSLCSKDFQGFFKDLRRRQKAKSVRYYGCGEYGQSTQRPHYHALLFGVRFLDRRVLRNDQSGTVWRSGNLEDCWEFGKSEFSAVTNASAAYVAGYVRNKISKKAYPEAYQRFIRETGEIVEVQQEFSRMSLKPAIGREWIEKYWADVYPRDFVVLKGREYRPPRYYDKFMDLEDEKGGAFERRSMMCQVREKRLAEAEEVTDYELNARESEHMSRSGVSITRGKV